MAGNIPNVFDPAPSPPSTPGVGNGPPLVSGGAYRALLDQGSLTLPIYALNAVGPIQQSDYSGGAWYGISSYWFTGGYGS